MTAKIQIGDICKNGHIVAGDNLRKTKVNGKEGYRCATCQRDYQKQYGRTEKGKQRNSSRANRNYLVNKQSIGYIEWHRQYSANYRAVKKQQKLDAELEFMAKFDDTKPSLPWNSLAIKGEAREALESLNDALSSRRSKCYDKPELYEDYDDPRFPDEWDEENPRHIPDKETQMSLCSGCPVFELCDAYAKMSKPDFGLHAGKFYVNGKEMK